MENVSNLINDVLELFKTDEFSKRLGELLCDDNIVKECCSDKPCCNKKDDNVKSYGYYDKKIYKDNKLYDHIEKKYEDGKCYSIKHEPNNGACGYTPVDEAEKKKCVEHTCKKECNKECEHKCEGNCEDYKKEIEFLKKVNNDYKEEYKKLLEEQEELTQTLDTIRDTAKELMATLKVYEKENTELKEKLNNIKKMF